MNKKIEIAITAYEDSKDLTAKIISHHLIRGESLVEVTAKFPLAVSETARELAEFDRVMIVDLMSKEDIPF